MVPEIKQGGNFMKDKDIYGESNVKNTAERLEEI